MTGPIYSVSIIFAVIFLNIKLLVKPDCITKLSSIW